MKRTLFLVLMLAMAFAQRSSNIQGALNQLEDTTRSFLGVVTFLSLLGGILLTAIGTIIYFKKLKNVEKREMLWLALALVCGAIGIITLLAGIIGLIIYVLVPSLIESLVA